MLMSLGIDNRCLYEEVIEKPVLLQLTELSQVRMYIQHSLFDQNCFFAGARSKIID
jgi:hypothetical protein